MSTSKKNKKFEESYFDGYYKNAVGDFSSSDLELSRRWFWSWLKKLNQYVPITKGKGKKILEIGCSIGGVTSLLVENGFEVWASDISNYAVKNAQKLTPQAKFLVFDIQEKIPVRTKFDYILSFEVVEHLEDPEKAFKNMYNSLENKGTVIVSTPYPYPWNFNDPTHINVKYPEEWVKMMKKVGFKQVKYHRFTLFPYFYKLNKHFQVILPFAVALPYINSPIFFIGKK